jgi:DNA-binding response OmpR family regulator
MVTALDDDRDKLEGFQLGADDYVTKPFNPNELIARIHAILRRSARDHDRMGTASDSITLRNCQIDLPGRRLLVDGSPVTLRAKEFDLLATLATHRGAVLSREQLLERVWASEYDGDTRTVDVHISRLRERLEGAGATIAIETVRAVGYRLDAN